MPSVLDILRPSVVTGLMNEIKTPFDRWQNFFGMGPNGPSTVKSETRSVSVDIVNDDRTVSTFTAPGANANVIAPMVIGNRQITAPRTFEKLPLSYEILNNIRKIGEGASSLDQAGLSYIKQQAGHMKRRTARWREFLIWGMLRGSCQFTISGQDWIPVASGGTVTLDWQVSANHKNQLNGIIGASWDTTTTDIVTDLAQISAQSEEDCGLPITHAWCNNSRWVKILNNDQVQTMGGAVNMPADQYSFTTNQFPDPLTSVTATQNEWTGRLRAYPSIQWHVTDRGIKLNGTFTKFLGDDEVIFHPDPDMGWTFMYEVKESANQGPTTQSTPTDVYGYGAWIKHPVDADTPMYVLYSLDNAFPVVNPNAIFFADVTP